MFTANMKDLTTWKELKRSVVTHHLNLVHMEEQLAQEVIDGKLVPMTPQPVVTNIAVFYKNTHSKVRRNWTNPLNIQVASSSTQIENLEYLDEIKNIYPESWNVEYVIMMSFVDRRHPHVSTYEWSELFPSMRNAIERKTHEHEVFDMQFTASETEQDYEFPTPGSLTEVQEQNDENKVYLKPYVRRAAKIVAALKDISLDDLVSEAVTEKLQALSLVDKSVAIMYNKFIQDYFSDSFDPLQNNA